MVSTPSKNISQNGNLPQIGVKIKNMWNHHLVHLSPHVSVVPLVLNINPPFHIGTFFARHLGFHRCNGFVFGSFGFHSILRGLKRQLVGSAIFSSLEGKKKSSAFLFWKAWFFGAENGFSNFCVFTTQIMQLLVWTSLMFSFLFFDCSSSFLSLLSRFTVYLLWTMGVQKFQTWYCRWFRIPKQPAWINSGIL